MLYDAVLNSNTCDRSQVHPCCMDKIQKYLSNIDEPCKLRTPLYIANHISVVELLIKHGANVDGIKKEGSENTYYYPPIFNAIGEFNYKKLELLLKSCADPDVVGDLGTIHENALFFAVSLRSVFSFDLLTSFGASLINSSGDSVLSYCLKSLGYASPKTIYQPIEPYIHYTQSMEYGRNDKLFHMIISLVRMGAKVRPIDVVTACVYGHLGFAKYLLKHTDSKQFTCEDYRKFYEYEALLSIIHNLIGHLDVFIFYVNLIRGAFSRQRVKNECTLQIKRSRDNKIIAANSIYYRNLYDLVDDDSFPSLFQLISFHIEHKP